MGAEVGASALWAGFNVMLAANLFREAASLATQIQGETIPTDKPGALSMTVRQSAGVVLSIVPWNGPVVLAARAIDQGQRKSAPEVTEALGAAAKRLATRSVGR